MKRFIGGLFLAVVIGIPLGIFIGWFKLVEKLLDPLLQVFRNTSTLALFPVFLLFFGLGKVSKLILEHLRDIPSEYDHAISPAFVLGSTLDRPLAAELKAGFLGVSYPIVNRVVTDQSYVGYRGGLRLATEIFSVIPGNR